MCIRDSFTTTCVIVSEKGAAVKYFSFTERIFFKTVRLPEKSMIFPIFLFWFPNHFIQKSCCILRFGFSLDDGKVHEHISAVFACHSPVSYTHLDVYKRQVAATLRKVFMVT